MFVRPNVHILESMRAQRPDYHLCIGEAVDNAFDAGATEVKIILRPNKIVVQDNGRGISRDKIAAVATLGEHSATPSTRLGRYGVGIKLQALICGDVLEVETASNDGIGSLRVNWQRMIDRGDWEIEDPEWRQFVGGTTGTLVTIKDLRREPTKQHIQRTYDELSVRFYPALIASRSIIFNGEKILPAADPELTDVVDESVWVRSGKGARVRAGVLVDKKSPIYQTQVSYEHRVILPKSTFGCGDGGGTRAMFARVDLIGPWELSKFKDDLTDKDSDALEDAVEDLIKPILEKCRSESIGAAVREMQERLNDLLPPEIAAVRPENKKESSGQKEKDAPKNKRGEAQDAPEATNGPARARRSARGVMIEFVDGIFSEHGVGFFEPGRVNRIKLAKDSSVIDAFVSKRDDRSELALLTIAVAIYQEAIGKGELELEGDFGLRIAQTIAMQPSTGETK